MGTALLLITPHLRAVTFLWNGGSTGPGDNNWSTSTNWNGGTAPTTGGSNQDLQFAGSIRTSPNADGATAWAIRTITFNSGASAFTVGGTTINLGTGGIVNSSSNLQTINNALSFTGAQTWNASTGDLTIGGSVALGTRALTFNGAHNINVTGALSGSGNLATTAATATVVTLSGANSSYSGTTTINSSGTIAAGSNTAFGTGTLTLAGGTVAASGASHSLANALSLTASSTVGGAQNLTFTGNFSETGSNTLSITNTGTTAFTGSTFVLAENNQARTLTVNVAGTSGGASISNVVQDGTGSGADSLTKAGAGTLTLSGANTYTGVTTISGGTLSINSIANVSGGSSALGAPTSTANGTIQIGSGTTGATLAYTGGAATSNRVINLAGTTGGATIDASGSGALTLTSSLTATGAGAKTLTLTGTSTAANTLSGVIVNNSGTNTTSLVKSGTGTWVLGGTAANTYTGTTTVNAGTLVLSKTSGTNAITGNIIIGNGAGTATLQLGASQEIADTSALTINSGGVFDLNNYSETVASITGTGTIQLSGATGNILTVGDSTSTTFSGVIQNTGTGLLALAKVGTGTLTLSGANTFGGVTSVNAGTLIAANASALGTAGSATTTTVASGATVGLQGGTTLSSLENLSLTGTGDSGNSRNGALDNVSGNNTVAGTVTLSGSSQIGAATGTQLTLSGQVTGANALAIGGAGTVVLANNTNNYSGTTTVNNGATLVATANNALGSGTVGAAVASGGALVLSGGITVSKDTPGTPLLTLNGSGVGGTGALRSVSGNNQWNGDIALASSATITSATTGNLLTLGNTSYTNTISFGANTLTVDGPGNILFNSIVGGAGDTGGFVKNGTGTTTFTGNYNNYTGTTTVNQGTLILDTDSSPSAYNETIRGNLVIGTGNLTLSPDGVVVQYGAPSNNRNKISDTSAITIYSDGKLDLNSNDDTVGAITLAGGHITTGVGVLTLNGDVTTTSNAANQAAVIDGVLALGSSTRTFTVASGGLPSDLTINAKIESGSFIKAGAGTMTITSDNVTGGGYTGTTTVSAGVLNIQNSNALGGTANNDPASGTSVTSGAALQLQGGISVGTEALTLNGTGISNTGALRNVSGANSWAGAIGLASNSRINSDAGTLTVSGTITGANTNLTVGGSGNITLSGAIGTGSGGIAKDGSGTLVLSGTSTYSGATTISSGVVNVQNSSGLGSAASSASVASGAELQLQGGISVGSEALTLNGTGLSNTGSLHNISGTNSWAGAVTLASAARMNSDAGTLTVSGDIGGSGQNLSVGGSGNITLSGAIGTGSGTLTKDGTGTLMLSGSTANTFTGGLNLNDGTVVLGKTVVTFAAVNGPVTVGDSVGAANSALLQLGQNNQIGSTAAVTINSDGKLDLNGFSQTIGNFSGAGTLAIASGGTLTTGDASNTIFSGTLTGSGILLKQGNGTLTIASNTTFGGTVQVNAGTFALSAAASGTTIDTLILNGGTLLLGAGTYNVTNLEITGTSTIDFGNGVAATLNGTNFSITGSLPTGVLSIANWVNGVDYFFAQNWTSATLNTTGVAPMTQVTFNPSNASYTPSNTAWLPYGATSQITPAPEAAFYGAILMGLSLAGLALRRWRAAPKSSQQISRPAA